MKLILTVLLVSILVENQQILPSQPELAQLILYREKEFLSGLGKAYAFKINDKQLVKLSPNRYVQLSVPAGRLKIEFEHDYFSRSQPLLLQVQAGQTYYVKVAVEVDFLSAVMLVAPVEPQQARQELRRMKPERDSSTGQPD